MKQEEFGELSHVSTKRGARCGWNGVVRPDHFTATHGQDRVGKGPRNGPVLPGSGNPKPGPSFAPGTPVRYNCSPPVYGVVLREDRGCHWIDAGEHGELRCATGDLRRLREGE